MRRNTEKNLADVADEAISVLNRFFRQNEHTAKDIGVARVATAVLSAWTRQQQTRSAEKSTMFMVARELASDKEQLAEYVRLAMPDLSIVKSLPPVVNGVR